MSVQYNVIKNNEIINNTCKYKQYLFFTSKEGGVVLWCQAVVYFTLRGQPN